MQSAVNEFLTPRHINVTEDTRTHAKVVLEPLERGFGHTLGNALRRVLLSSMPGCAIIEAEIDGVLRRKPHGNVVRSSDVRRRRTPDTFRSAVHAAPRQASAQLDHVRTTCGATGAGCRDSARTWHVRVIGNGRHGRFKSETYGQSDLQRTESQWRVDHQHWLEPERQDLELCPSCR